MNDTKFLVLLCYHKSIDMVGFLFTKCRECDWDGMLSSAGRVSSVRALGSQGHPRAVCRLLHSS